MADNPYSPPKAQLRDVEGAAWLPTTLPSFLSSLLLVPLGFVIFGAVTRQPDFLLNPGFIATLSACSIASALVLRFYRRANWVIRALLAPPITFALLLLVIVGLRVVAT